ncbi:uncharacterized protein LOC135489297 isoform X2 [Lineus longissimus]|uniref:uncharacterized protein LOC135489297 isoform X2 n=1 Tax=Lineus longissimus TaxID=88925 RepID=UPI002B4DE5B9
MYMNIRDLPRDNQTYLIGAIRMNYSTTKMFTGTTQMPGISTSVTPDSASGYYFVILRPVGIVTFIIVALVIICRFWREKFAKCFDYMRPGQNDCNGLSGRRQRCCECLAKMFSPGVSAQTTSDRRTSDPVAQTMWDRNDHISLGITDMRAAEPTGTAELPPSYDSLRRRGEFDVPGPVQPMAQPPITPEFLPQPPSYDDATKDQNRPDFVV